MIDFVSTHPSADPQTVACAHLLAAIIAQAIDDASNKQSSGADANAAIVFLFDERSIFPHYAELIGANAQTIREALLAPHVESEVKPIKPRFGESHRRIFKANYLRWIERKNAEQKALAAMKGEA